MASPVAEGEPTKPPMVSPVHRSADDRSAVPTPLQNEAPTVPLHTAFPAAAAPRVTQRGSAKPTVPRTPAAPDRRGVTWVIGLLAILLISLVLTWAGLTLFRPPGL